MWRIERMFCPNEEMLRILENRVMFDVSVVWKTKSARASYTTVIRTVFALEAVQGPKIGFTNKISRRTYSLRLFNNSVWGYRGYDTVT
jgi:hypothetical protein